MKKKVAAALAARVKDGEVIGLGSGSTVELAVSAIGERVRNEGLKVTAVPTSHRTAMHASEVGILVLSPSIDVEISWAFDGADEVDPAFNMIKGNGAAMLHEKIVAERAGKLVIIVTEEKLVEQLGSKFPVPIEVIPEALYLVKKNLASLGAKEIVVRAAQKKYGPVVTEDNNLILDVSFEDLQPAMAGEIKKLTGVVETGLFIGFNQELLVAKESGVVSQNLVDGKIVESPI